MNRRFWLGVITGIAAITALRTAALAAVHSLLRDADMAEERAWTGDAADDELRTLLLDANGQQP